VRQITSNAQTAATTKMGHEPILVVHVWWGGRDFEYPNFTGHALDRWYATRDVVFGAMSIPGSILKFTSPSQTKKQDSVGAYGAMSFTLNDSDGLVRQSVDATTLSQVRVDVYQWFPDLTSSEDLTLLMVGWILGPIEWSDDERQVTFVRFECLAQ